MIAVNRHTLSNGLRIVHNEDRSTQMVAINVLYDVGARDEEEGRTGFAHLFEHLMFGGSVNIPDYDAPVQEAGGEKLLPDPTGSECGSGILVGVRPDAGAGFLVRKSGSPASGSDGGVQTALSEPTLWRQ